MSAVASKDARFALMSKYPGFEWQAGDWAEGMVTVKVLIKYDHASSRPSPSKCVVSTTSKAFMNAR